MDRRALLIRGGVLLIAAFLVPGLPGCSSGEPTDAPAGLGPDDARALSGIGPLTLLLAGDVMTGRGIDQVLPHSVDPRLYESHVKDARRYADLAERVHGPLPDAIGYAYVWGDAQAEMDRVAPDLRVVNLETAVTTSDDAWPGKGIHYRMHPGNVGVVSAARIDVCVLANNHVLDWGRAGLSETLETLHDAGVRTVGAGSDAGEAAAPCTVVTPKGRVLVFAWGLASAGVPESWVAGAGRGGVAWLKDASPASARRVIEHIGRRRRADDRVVVSLHWGGNWGYGVPEEHRRFAHALIEAGAADVVHGHSSHHPMGIEVHRGRLVLYGCGDLLNDYEGIGGREEYRPDLALLYFPTLDAAGVLRSLEMVPLRIRRFRLERASGDDAHWLATRLDRECRGLGTRVERAASDRLVLGW